MNNNFKPNKFSRNFNYIKINFVLMWKTLLEYKTELFSYVIKIPISLLVIFFTFYVIYDNFNFVLDWTLIEYGYYIVLFDLISKCSFWLLKPLHSYIINGKLNIYLVRPLNIFVQFNFDKIYPHELIDIFVNSIIFIVLLIIDKNLNIFNPLFIICLILVIICMTLLWFLFESISFLSLGLKKALGQEIFEINSILRNFPAEFFNKSILKYPILIFPNAFISLILVNILQGEVINFYYILILISLIIFFGIGIFINWKYGLKKYEAFG